MKTLKKTEHGSGYDKYTTTYLIDTAAVQEILGKKIDFSSFDNEFPNDHYFAEAMAKLIAHTGQQDDVLLKTGLYIFKGRDGILAMAFEKLLWELNHKETTVDDNWIATVTVQNTHGLNGETLRIDDDIDDGYRLTLTELAV